MTLKAKILAVALSAGLVSPAVASPFTADDMQRVFTQDAPMHLATLSQSEMQDTKGSWFRPFIGGLPSSNPYITAAVRGAGAGASTDYFANNGRVTWRGMVGGAAGGWAGRAASVPLGAITSRIGTPHVGHFTEGVAAVYGSQIARNNLSHRP